MIFGLRFGLLLAVISLATKSEADVQKVFDEFAKAKVIETCFGEENSRLYTEKIVTAIRECSVNRKQQQQEPKTPVDTLEMQQPQEQDASTSIFEGFDWQDLFRSSKYVNFGGNRIIPLPYPVNTAELDDLMFFRRSKRQIQEMLFDQNAIRHLKERVTDNLSNVTCVLKKMNYVNDEFQLEFDYMVQEIKNFRLSPELESDLIYGLEHCKDKTTCLPVQRMRTALPPNIKRVMHFSKCTEEQRFIACMKNDLRNQRHKFDLRGLDGILSNLDEDDQMLAVVWTSTILNSGQKHIFDIAFKK